MVKAQQNPTASLTQGSPTSSSSKPKSAKPKSDQTKSKVKTKPSSSQAKPKVKSKSSKDELLQMARLLIAQAKSQSDKTRSEEGSNGSNSSEGSTNQDPYGPQFQDAQDPYIIGKEKKAEIQKLLQPASDSR
ncbi:unnamed protein product [Camellia sinensis]